MDKTIINALKEYFLQKPSVAMAFVFGSYAAGREMEESDFDVAVYFEPESDIEKEEDDVWFEISEIIKKEVGLVCLNKAPASLVSNIFKTGIPIIIKDKRLYWEVYLRVSSEAEDFLRFLEDFYRIKQNAKSLVPEEKSRLILKLDYLRDELKEFDRFNALTPDEYTNNKDARRNIERWAENIINATIDIAKIILASEKKTMPRTYENALADFGRLAGLDEKETDNLAQLANLRNILAHEYLEILYKKIRKFIEDIPSIYKKILNFVERYLKQK